MKEYAIYKGDTLLGIGTRKELAEKLKVKATTITWWCSPTNYNRNKDGNRKVGIRL